MRYLKFVFLSVLILAITEASLGAAVLGTVARLAVAALILIYGLWTLNLFRNPSKLRNDSPSPEVAAPREIVHLLFSAGGLLLWRIAFVFLAYSFLCQACGLYAPRMLLQHGSGNYLAYLLTVLNQTFPPIAALIQFLIPDINPVQLNFGHPLTLALRVGSYAMFYLVVVVAAKEVWTLGKQSQFQELDRRVRLNRLRDS